MNSKCPKCSAELGSDDYGMVTCPGCGSLLFVDMDGNAQAASEEPAAATPSATHEEFGALPVFEPLPQESAGAAGIETPQDFPSIQPMPPAADANVDRGASDTSGAALDMNAFLGYAGDDGNNPPTVPPSALQASQNDPNDPLGISAYANSEISSAKDGPLVLDLIISGIDSKDLRTEIREALQDSRFGWDTSALMASIKSGVLRISRVSPVKATIIINRIKNLSLQIRWEQNAITEIDPVGKEP